MSCINYSREALLTIGSSVRNIRVHSHSLNQLKNHGIIAKSTRRGSRGGISKVRPIKPSLGFGRYSELPSLTGLSSPSPSVLFSLKPGGSSLLQKNKFVLPFTPFSQCDYLHNLVRANNLRRRVGSSNLTYISTQELEPRVHNKRSPTLPGFLLSNVMSLTPKIDEIRHSVTKEKVDFACFTESWLKDSIPDNVINIPNFNVIRKDRPSDHHGGVCIYIHSSIPYQVLDMSYQTPLEVLWIKLSPYYLPRGLSSIVIGTVYHPPSANDEVMRSYLIDQLFSIESTHTSCGIILLGDFNRLDTRSICNLFKLKQFVNFHTRKDQTLDLVLTNMHQFYEDPQKLAPFGLSDHFTVKVKSKSSFVHPKKVVYSRDLRPSVRSAISSFLGNIDWSIISSFPTCEARLGFFENIVQIGLDNIAPIKPHVVHDNEPPWINPHFKSLIKQRQNALSNGDMPKFRSLRNIVNRERKKCRSNFFSSKVQQLKETKPKNWWKAVKAISGMDPISSSINLSHLIGPNSTDYDLANTINKAFLEPMKSFVPLVTSTMSTAHPICQDLLVSESAVFKKLCHLNPSKSSGPDDLPSWLLRENADVLTSPITSVLNASYNEQLLPNSWKMANVSPIPKTSPVTDVNKDLRPISLTPILSKIAEDFVVDQHLKPAVLKIIDTRQFGTVPKSSTTHALISVLHSLFSATDGTGAQARLVLFDFRKAFDLIDHQMLVQKIQKLDLQPGIIGWIINFLTNRLQRVKLPNQCFSDWAAVPAGVPQGTKLGPWLFALMINDIHLDTPMWKYVDDTSILEIVPKYSSSTIQTLVDSFETQSSACKFELNEKKCQEFRVDFSKSPANPSPVLVHGKPLELKKETKLLGLTISNNLKWNTHVESTIKKASKRIYFLKQLKRAKIPKKDMVLFYSTCIRPVLEYASPVFHYSLPNYLIEDLERVQKRALKIIFNGQSYLDSLAESNLQTLHARRQLHTERTFADIVSNQSHKLHHLLPELNNYNRLRNNRRFNIPRCKTKRFKDSFIIASASRF